MIMVTYIGFLASALSLGFVGNSFALNETFMKIGTIGQPLLLNPHAEEQDFSKMILKYVPQPNTRFKLMEHDAVTKKDTMFNSSMSKQYRFNEKKGWIEIDSLRKENQGLYELLIEKGSAEKVYFLDVNAYEEISNVSIELNHNPQNESCVTTLNCTMKKGDGASFSWSQDNLDLSHSSNVLQITLDNANSLYTCRAKNLVSEGSTSIKPGMGCNRTAAPAKLFPLGYIICTAAGVLVIIIVLLILFKYRSQKKNGKHTLNSTMSLPIPEATQVPITIYSTVQKAKGRASLTSPPQEFSTVYELAGQMFMNSHHSAVH